MSTLRRYLIAGLLVWLPLGVTVLVIKLLVDVMDQTLLLLPIAYQPETLLGFRIPGLGVVLSIAVVFITGVVVANLFGRRVVAAWESLLARIPLVRSIYAGAKQVAETVFSPTGKSFRKVLLIEYPRRGLWTIGFQSGPSCIEAKIRSGEDLITVFIPTTPNPTSGFIILVPAKDALELDMSIDEAFKLIVSLGVVVPDWRGAVPPELVAQLVQANSKP